MSSWWKNFLGINKSRDDASDTSNPSVNTTLTTTPGQMAIYHNGQLVQPITGTSTSVSNPEKLTEYLETGMNKFLNFQAFKLSADKLGLTDEHTPLFMVV